LANPDRLGNKAKVTILRLLVGATKQLEANALSTLFADTNSSAVGNSSNQVNTVCLYLLMTIAQDGESVETDHGSVASSLSFNSDDRSKPQDESQHFGVFFTEIFVDGTPNDPSLIFTHSSVRPIRSAAHRTDAAPVVESPLMVQQFASVLWLAALAKRVNNCSKTIKHDLSLSSKRFDPCY
jgi:hypothetical protein